MVNFKIILLFIPAFVANSAPVVLAKIPLFNRFNLPVSKTFLGKNKTWRGLIGGVLSGMIVAMILSYYAVDSQYLNTLYGSTGNSLLAGFLLGFGALVGDMVKSGFKRRLKIAPGAAFPPWDGVDYMIGSMLFIFPVYRVTPIEMTILLIAGPVLSLIANIFSYSVGMKKVWW